MRHARGELAERREFLVGDDLILRLFQIGKRRFQLLVLAPQFFGELLHQVEPLHFQGVASEHLQRRCHVRHFVAPADVHRRFQIAVRHGAHAVRKAADAPQQHTPDEQPRDQHGAHHAHDVEAEQQRAACVDGLRGSFGGAGGACPGVRDEAFHLVHQVLDEFDVGRQQRLLIARPRQFQLA